MKEYLFYAPLLLVFGSLFEKRILLLAIFAFVTTIGIKVLDADSVGYIAFYRFDIFIGILSLVALVYLSFRIKQVSIRSILTFFILLLAYNNNNFLNLIIYLECLTLVLLENKRDILGSKFFVGIIIKSFLLYVVFERMASFEDVSGLFEVYNYGLSVPVAYMGMAYYLFKTFELVDILPEVKSDFDKIILFVVNLIVISMFLHHLDVFTTNIFNLLKPYAYYYLLLIVFLCALFRKGNIKLFLLSNGVMFTSCIFNLDGMYMIILSSPILLYFLNLSKFQVKMGPVLNFNNSMVPLSYSFLVFMLPVMLGNDFIRKICSGLVVIFIMINFYEDATRQKVKLANV